MSLTASHRDIKQLRRWVRDREACASDRVFVVEGPRAIAALRERGVEPRFLYVADDAADDAVGDACGPASSQHVTVAAGVLDKVGDTRASQGVIAVYARPDDRAMADAASTTSWVVVLSRVNDPGNLGTIARSAQAAGVGAIVVGPGSVDPYNPKTVRAGAGAIGSLPVWAPTEEAEVRELLDRTAARGGVRLGADAGGSMRIDDAPLVTDPLALVFGHETAGLGALALDATFTIPMAAKSESLNLAMAATVACFETARRRRAVSQ